MRFIANFHDDGASFDASASESGASFDATIAGDQAAFDAVVDTGAETFPASVRDDDRAFGVDFVGYVENNTGGGGGGAAVLYTPMELNEDQQRQARENIGALDRGFETVGVFTREDGTYFANVTYRELIQHLAAGKTLYAMLDGVRYPLVQSVGTWLYFGKMNLPSGTGTTWHYTYIGINSSDKVLVTKPQIPISAITLTGLDSKKLVYVNGDRELESLELDEAMRIEDGALLLDDDIKQPGPQGEPGAPGKDGERGTGILTVEHSPFETPGTVDGVDYMYKYFLNAVKDQAKVDAVYAGDYIMCYGRYLYRVVYVDESSVYVGPQIDIKGKDGISVTHKWQGTTLEVTSASGVSSADLQGPRGEAGPAGERGEAGPAGAAGRRGTGIYRTTSEPEAYTGTVDGKQMIARTPSSEAYLPGDMLLWRSTLYRVAAYDYTYAYMDAKWSIQGEPGEPGSDGTSVTVSSVVESTEDGGENIVTFSDGTVLIVRNGNAGSSGGTVGVEGELRVVVQSKDTQTIINKSYPVSKTNAEIYEAYSSGRQVALYDASASGATDLTTERYEAYRIERNSAYFYRDVVVKNKATVRKWWLIGGTYSDRASLSENAYIAPNPYALTINGKSYDGSAAVNVDIEAGGTDILMVNFSSEDGETWTADKTHAEMLAAHNEGKLLRADMGDGEILPLIACNEGMVWFGLVMAMDGQSMSVIMQVYANDEISFSISPITAESNVMVVRPVEPITDGGGMKCIVDHTSDEIVEAVQAGKLVVFAMTATLTLERFDTSAGCVFGQFSPDPDADTLNVGTYTTATVEGNVAQLMEYHIKPKVHPLTINGVEYDGSKSVEVNISGGGGGSSKYTQPGWCLDAPEVVLPEETCAIVDQQGYIMQQFTLEVGQEYVVVYNGTDYRCTAFRIDGTTFVGNAGVVGGSNTGEPFILAAATPEEAAEHGIGGLIMDISGAASVTVSIAKQVIHKIPAEYIDDKVVPLMVNLINLTGSAASSVDVDFATIEAATREGRAVYLSTHDAYNGVCRLMSINMHAAVFCYVVADTYGVHSIIYYSLGSDGGVTRVEKGMDMPTTDELVSAVIAALPVYGGETA